MEVSGLVGGLLDAAAGAGLSGCSDNVKRRLQSFREGVQPKPGNCFWAGEGESASGGHFGRMGLQADPASEAASAPWRVGVSSRSDRGGQEIFSLLASGGLSDLSADPCPRASMVAVSTLTLARGESSTVGLVRSECLTEL